MAVPDPTDPIAPGWWAGFGTFLVAAGAAIGIVRGVRKDARQSAEAKQRALEGLIDRRANERIEELVTPQIEALTNEIRAVGASVKQELRDLDERRRTTEQEHHEENLVRLTALETDMKEVKDRERRRVRRPDLDR